MKLLRTLLDKPKPLFEKGGKLEKLYPLYELVDTFLYTPGEVTRAASHIRDGIDLKRMMITVAIALQPAIIMGQYNVGLQANTAMQAMGLTAIPGWRGAVMAFLGVGIDPTSILSNIVHGALYFVPIFLVTNIVGGFWEAIFAIVRKHEVNEGFLVTGLLFPLTLAPTVPLWQVAIGISFGVVVGKEIFGGTGKNILNPALTARAFLFFAYPAQLSGDAVWTAVDGFSGATALGLAAAGGPEALAAAKITMGDAFFGFIQGSMGETSTIACIAGAGLLILSGVGSWRIMLSVLLGAVLTVLLLNWIGSDTNPMFGLGPLWHIVLGGFAFGLVFMATDPVSASMTFKGQYFYGALIGFMVILVRVINPAFPEGMMLAILFGNIFAPVIDDFVVKANIKRRKLRGS